MQYRQYTAGAANSTTTSTMDIRMDDTITQVVLDLIASAPADNDTYYVELSWQQTPSQGINDISNVILSTQINFDLVTSGAVTPSKTITIEPNLKVFQGERLYLHTVNTGTGLSKAYANIVTGKEPPKTGRGR